MKTTRFTQALVVFASLFASAAVPAATNKDLDEAMSADGLQRTKLKGIALVYALPGATLADYDQIRLPPVQVSFRKDFAPNKPGSHMKLSTAELEKIRTGVGELVHEEFSKVLRQGGTYTTYSVNAGEMTLIAELVDSETGAVLARIIDRREARDSGMMTWSTSATNSAEARYIASRWAKIFKERLDAAHAIGK